MFIHRISILHFNPIEKCGSIKTTEIDREREGEREQAREKKTSVSETEVASTGNNTINAHMLNFQFILLLN